MNFVIDTGFIFRGIRFGPGEEVPEKMSNEEIEELFRQGKLAKIVNGEVVRFQREIELNDAQIDLLLTNPLPIIEATLESGNFSKETIGRINIRAIQRNLPQVVKLLKSKIKTEEVLPSVEKVEKEQEKPKQEVKQEGKNEETGGSVGKMTVHCLKCGEKKECEGEVIIKDTQKRKGMKIFKGVCPTCGMKVNKFLPKGS